MTDEPTPTLRSVGDPTLDAIREQHLRDLQSASPPPDRTDTKDLIYAWQMLNDKGVWNIIGIGTPGGLTLPLVTTAFNVAWEAFSIAQEHADKYRCECRLAAFSFDGVTAIVHPREAE